MGAPLQPEHLAAIEAAVTAEPDGRLTEARCRARQAFMLMRIKITAQKMMMEAAEHGRYCPQAFSAIQDWCDDGLLDLAEAVAQ